MPVTLNGTSQLRATREPDGHRGPHLVRFAGIRPGASVLDVACGTGAWSRSPRLRTTPACRRSPPPQWGDPNIVRERLGSAVTDLVFMRNTMYSQTQ
jgi:hypothetical protein